MTPHTATILDLHALRYAVEPKDEDHWSLLQPNETRDFSPSVIGPRTAEVLDQMLQARFWYKTTPIGVIADIALPNETLATFLGQTVREAVIHTCHPDAFYRPDSLTIRIIGADAIYAVHNFLRDFSYESRGSTTHATEAVTYPDAHTIRLTGTATIDAVYRQVRAEARWEDARLGDSFRAATIPAAWLRMVLKRWYD